jgi:4-coumarate--CoA ligase (photoactive yellow protein activation family)
VLEEEVDALAQYFSDRQRIVTVMPSHHIFGFVTSVLLPKRLKIPVLRMHPLPVAELFQTFQPGDLFIAFPRFWQIMLEMLQIKKETALALPADFAGLSSSAPCPVKIIEGLTGQSAPGAPAYCTGFVEIYGSTETSAVGVRTDCHSPYTLLPSWVRASHKEGKESEVEIERIRRDGRRETALALPDIVQWVDERAFFPLKRKDKAVQVGGFNVYPQQVADIIRTHPAVKDCVVRLMRPDEGGRLKAFIVLKNPWRTELRAVFGKEFKTWLREHIDSPAIPKAITFGENLPLTMTGKNSDWNIK